MSTGEGSSIDHPLLLSASHKLRWAERHRESLQQMMTDFFAVPGNRATLRADLEEASGYHVFRVSALPDYTLLTADVGLGIGDVVSSLRAALDHAVWAIVSSGVSIGAHPDPEGIAFPIRHDVAALAKSRVEKAVKPYVDPTIWQIVERFQLDQPYPGPTAIDAPWRTSRADQQYQQYLFNDHPLATLQTLSNADKHHALAVVFVVPGLWGPRLGPIATRQVRIAGPGERGPVALSGHPDAHPGDVVELHDLETAVIAGTPLEANLEVGRARFVTAPPPHVDDAGEIVPGVLFTDGSWVTSTLDRVASFVAYALGELAQVLSARA